MWIMTEDGWKQLEPREFVQAEPARAFNGVPPPYNGKFPSAEVCDFHNRMKEKMKFFDDGVRMVHGRADRVVEVDNAIAEHPIKYPPKGWEH